MKYNQNLKLLSIFSYQNYTEISYFIRNIPILATLEKNEDFSLREFHLYLEALMTLFNIY